MVNVQPKPQGMQVRALVHTDVVKYLEFKAVDGSYVFVKGKARPQPFIHTLGCWGRGETCCGHPV